MTQAADARYRRPLALGLGAYAALTAVLPFRASLAAAALPLGAAAAWTVLNRPHRWLPAFLAAAVLLPPLPIAIGDSGPHPAVLFAGAGLLVGAWRWRTWRLRTGGPSGALLAYLFAILLSLCPAALYSGPSVAAASLARALLFAISVYVFFYVAHGPGGDCVREAIPLSRWMFFAGMAAALAACVDFYYQLPAPAGFAPQFVWLDSGVVRRAQGFFYEASTLGNFCAFFLVMAAVGLTSRKGDSPVARPWLLAGSGLLAAALLLSYSRASIVNVVVALAALAIVRRGSIPWRAFAGMAATVAAGAAAVSIFRPAFAGMYWERMQASVTFIASAPERILSGRLESWQTVVEFIARDPWRAMAGVGYKTLPYSDVLGRPVVADNAYLSAFVETGAAGLFALLLLNLAILRSAWHAARNPDRTAAFFGAWIFCFWAGQSVQMLSGDLLTYWRVLPLYLWSLAVAVRAADEHPLP